MAESFDYDVVIIGSGVAGALAAWKLAQAEFKVLILEAGEGGEPRVNLVGHYAMAMAKTPHSPYVSAENDAKVPSPDKPDDYDQPAAPNPQYKSTYERRVGGSTWHWLGHTPRLIPNDFRLHSAYGVGVDWPISYLDLEPWYCAAEEALGVAGDSEAWQGILGGYRSRPFPMGKIWPSYSDLKVAQIIDGQMLNGVEIQVLSTPSARNSQAYDGRPPCAGNSICVPICPIQAKYDATVHIAKAKKAGAQIREKAVDTRLEVGPDTRIKHVVYKSWDNQEHTVSGRIVILAANAIETAKLLLMSASDALPCGVANSSDQVGRNLMDHLQKTVIATSPEPLFPFRGPPSTSGIEAFRDGEIRRTRSAFRLSLGNDGWSRIDAPNSNVRELVSQENMFGEALRQRLRSQVQSQFRMSFSTEVLPRSENRVTPSEQKKDALGIPIPKIAFQPEPYTTQGFQAALDAIDFILNKIQAQKKDYGDPPLSYSGAGHVMGTCRMGSDPNHSVVNAQCRAHDHPNLYVLGAGVFPTCGTANPTLTLAALTLRSTEAIAAQLKGR